MRPRVLVLVAVLALLAGACSAVDEQLDQLRGQVDDVTEQARGIADRAQFCLAITRALTSLDGAASTADARDAAEEVLTQVPDALREDAALVAERLEEAAAASDPQLLQDQDFRDAAGRLRDGTRELCAGAA